MYTMFIKNKFRKFSFRCFAGALGACLLFPSLPVQATEKEELIAHNRALPIESNGWSNWPAGPVVNAESAILMDADTGVILYSKNIHKQQYPASTTKILTTLIAIENSSLDELVEFSYKATHDIDPGSNHIGLDAGEKLSMEDSLKAILVRSANEVSFGVAEHIAKDQWESFAPIMNERAKELGCLNSHFVNPNGLPNEEHVSTAYDLAMIGRAFFANEILCQMTKLKQIHFYPSEGQPDEIWENNQMALIPGREYAYEGLVGCKTGYTNVARSCLVSCAEKNGLKLICVVLKDESPYQYEDTIALFEYGFQNFEKKNVSQNETRYNITSADSLYSDRHIFGTSDPLLALNKDDYLVLPKNTSFDEVTSTIDYTTVSETRAAKITYTFHDAYVGSAYVDFTLKNHPEYTFETPAGEEISEPTATSLPSQTKTPSEKEPSFIFINWEKVFIFVAILIGLLVILAFVLLFIRNYQINLPRKFQQARKRKYYRNRNNRPSPGPDFREKRKQQIAAARRRQRRTRRH